MGSQSPRTCRPLCSTSKILHPTRNVNGTPYGVRHHKSDTARPELRTRTPPTIIPPSQRLVPASGSTASVISEPAQRATTGRHTGPPLKKYNGVLLTCGGQAGAPRKAVVEGLIAWRISLISKKSSPPGAPCAGADRGRAGAAQGVTKESGSVPSRGFSASTNPLHKSIGDPPELVGRAARVARANGEDGLRGTFPGNARRVCRDLKPRPVPQSDRARWSSPNSRTGAEDEPDPNGLDASIWAGMGARTLYRLHHQEGPPGRPDPRLEPVGHARSDPCWR